MAKDLIIVESAAKASTISKFLKGKYNILASMGHVRDLPTKELGVDLENDFKPKYVADRTKSKVINALKEAIQQADTVYLAADPDREGEAIAWHLTQMLKKELKDKAIQRIEFNEITQKAVQDSLNNPRSIDENKVNAQQARRILDRIVGYQISPFLWKTINKGLSAGRVQSVALRLICEREEEIKAFVPQEYWSITADFYKDGAQPFKSTLEKVNGKKVEILKEEDAKEIISKLKNNDIFISDISKTQRQLSPLPPFITSTLQQEASKILNFSAKKTMTLAQKLYEGVDMDGERVGLISYMRTDSVRMSEEATTNCRALISERWNKSMLHSSVRKFDNKNKAQDAHEAIRPTDTFKTPEVMARYLDKDHLKLYTLIWQRFIATQMKAAKLNTIKIEVEAGPGQFVTTGSTVEFQGFLEAYPHVKVNQGEIIDAAYVVKDKLLTKEFTPNQHFTKPPSRYSEASLIKEMESDGIGRPSTYASIINTIVTRTYVKMEKKLFVPTDLGVNVNAFLVQSFEKFFNVTFTAAMENELDDIEYGKQEYIALLHKYYNTLKDLMDGVDVKEVKKNLLEHTDIPCDKCGDGHMIVRWGTKGQFLSCSNFPKCKNVKNFTKDEAGTVAIKEEEKLEKQCPKCGSNLVVKEGRFGRFIACSNYPKCKYTETVHTGIKCPDCETGFIAERRNKRGKIFYSCTNYPDCKYISNYKPVALTCPNCNNPFVYEMHTSKDGDFKQCPKCKTIIR
ncbi:MAG: type I DNA topoisomerase [Candidatus Cloacimonetes bacterium]|nr:type I DNA topoisomerase [Candidatus Cloacimonadota bacterium]